MPKGVFPRKRIPLATRLWAHVVIGPDCWEWTGCTVRGGYGIIGGERGRERVYVHRAAYELMKGPIPDGLYIDHLCRNPRCCNPAHLEPVTHRENTLRGVSPPAVNIKKTHCLRGHEFTEANTYRWKGTRICRTCSDARYR